MILSSKSSKSIKPQSLSKKLRNWIHFRPLGRAFGCLGGRKASQSRPKSLPNPPQTSLGAKGPFYPAPGPFYSASPGSQKRPTVIQKAPNEDKVVPKTSTESSLSVLDALPSQEVDRVSGVRWKPSKLSEAKTRHR